MKSQPKLNVLQFSNRHATRASLNVSSRTVTESVNRLLFLLKMHGIGQNYLHFFLSTFPFLKIISGAELSRFLCEANYLGIQAVCCPLDARSVEILSAAD